MMEKTENNSGLPSLEGAKVLLVEAHRLNRLLIEKFLTKWDVKPDLAEDSVTTLRKVKENSYDLVLMNLMMPDTDGYETTQLIRRDFKFEELPIIALTAGTLEDIREKVLEFGMNGSLSKPFKPSDLHGIIAKYAGREVHTRVMTSPYVQEYKHKEGALLTLDGIREMAEGENEFYFRFIELNVETFELLPDNYQVAALDRDIPLLKSIIHKLRPTMILLDLTDLERLLDNGLSLLEALASEDEVKESVIEVQNICRQITEELKSELSNPVAL